MNMNTLRYGVFSLGQIWTVVTEDGMKIGFPTRELAISAARDMIDLHHAYGTPAELMIQDEKGAFWPFPLPPADGGTSRSA